MALEKTLAIVLKTFDWSESSRTIAFFAKDFGRIYLVDKGGKSIKSKRGRVLKFALLEVTFYDSKKETSGYIADVELIKMYDMSGDGSLGRIAYASAACELLEQLLP
ncbi:MAG: recombination protein O N-terminal domain-containing protein, partial [candidate division Zixibacteria bacterium]|nr:recombination protein O N-terminal domain-containing protein [candidate division Zixibacteria bacterium]